MTMEMAHRRGKGTEHVVDPGVTVGCRPRGAMRSSRRALLRKPDEAGDDDYRGRIRDSVIAL